MAAGKAPDLILVLLVPDPTKIGTKIVLVLA